MLRVWKGGGGAAEEGRRKEEIELMRRNPLKAGTTSKKSTEKRGVLSTSTRLCPVPRDKRKVEGVGEHVYRRDPDTARKRVSPQYTALVAVWMYLVPNRARSWTLGAKD